MKTYETKEKHRDLMKENEKHVPAKRINIVSLKLVKESSLLYKERKNNG